MSRFRGALACGLLAAALACSKPPPPPPVPLPPPVAPTPPPLSPPFTVTAMNLGNRVYTDNNVIAPAAAFGRKDTIYLSVVSDGLDPNVVLRTRWYGPKGILVKEDSQSIASLGPKATAFHLSGLPVGEYSVELFVNERPAGSKQFEILAKPPAKN